MPGLLRALAEPRASRGAAQKTPIRCPAGRREGSKGRFGRFGGRWPRFGVIWTRLRGFRGRSGRFRGRFGSRNCILGVLRRADPGAIGMFHEEIVTVEPLYFRDRVKKLKKPSQKRLTQAGRSD